LSSIPRGSQVLHVKHNEDCERRCPQVLKGLIIEDLVLTANQILNLFIPGTLALCFRIDFLGLLPLKRCTHCSETNIMLRFFFQKGTPPGPTNHILAILRNFSYFLYVLAVLHEFYWKDMYMCIHFIKYTYLFHFPWGIYTSMCFSDATPVRGVEKKMGGREKRTKYIYIFIYLFLFFCLTPPIYYICCYPSPGLVSRNGTAL